MASQRDNDDYNDWHSATSDPSALANSAATGDTRRYRGYRSRLSFSYGPIDPYYEPYVDPPFDQRVVSSTSSFNHLFRDPSSDALISTTLGLPPPAHASECPMTPQCLDLPVPRSTDVRSPLSFDESQETKRLFVMRNLTEQLTTRQAAGYFDHNYAAIPAGHDGLFSFGPPSPAIACPVSSSSEESWSLKALEVLSLADAACSPVRASVFASEDLKESGYVEATLARTSSESSPARRPASTESTSTLPESQDVAASGNGSPLQSSVTATSRRAGCGRRRKATPRKRPSGDDPGFKNAVVETELLPTGGQPVVLRVEHYYKDKKRRRILAQDSSDSEDDFGIERRVKQCTSCATISTPLWRSAEDGTLLCNACGIRYKKHKVRCTRCWYIPKKNRIKLKYCVECGGFMKNVFKYWRP